MPRRFLKKVLPDRHALSQRWFMKPFVAVLKHPAYWNTRRRSVMRAYALGILICFIPLPVHLLLAPLAAVALRANVAVTIITTFLVNPFTALPAFFAAYWVGAQLLDINLMPMHTFDRELIESQLLHIWKPLLLGCLVIGVSAATLGSLLISLVWRWRVNHRYSTRPAKLRGKKSASGQKDAP